MKRKLFQSKALGTLLDDLGQHPPIAAALILQQREMQRTLLNAYSE